ncbi:Proto-oncogene tyrosine-protein kinase ROS [Manis javanica]|nr:Proto-oncogene tyrosine-protein kinase ROS [Manis javanica]
MADGLRGLGPPRRGDRPERPRHQQLRDRHRRRLLGPQPRGHDHARDRHHGHGPGGFQKANHPPMFQEFTKYQGHVCNPKRMAEFTARCFDRAISEMGPTQLNIPRDYFYGEVQCEIPKPMRVERGSGGENSLQAATELLATAKFPVILAGGGVVMGDAVEECRKGPSAWAHPWSRATCAMTPSPPSTRCGPARWVTRAPRPR